MPDYIPCGAKKRWNVSLYRKEMYLYIVDVLRMDYEM